MVNRIAWSIGVFFLMACSVARASSTFPPSPTDAAPLDLQLTSLAFSDGAMIPNFFSLYALKIETLGLTDSASHTDVEKAVAGQIQATIQLMGKYSR